MGFDVGDVIGTATGAAQAAWSTASEAAGEVRDLYTGEDSDAAERAESLTAEFREATDERIARAAVNSARTGDTASADSVVVPEAFDGMSHPEMFAHTVELTPEALDSGAALWRETHGRMTGLVWALWNELGSVLGTDWRGAAADAALSSVADYRSQSLRTLDLMDTVALRLEQSRDGFALTRATMPPPQSFTPSDWARTAMSVAMLGPVGAVGSVTDMMNEENERRLEAVAVMNGTYVPTIVQADTSVPLLPPPADPVSGPAGGPVPSATSGGSGGWSTVSPASGLSGSVAADSGAANSGAAGSGTWGFDASGSDDSGSDTAAPTGAASADAVQSAPTSTAGSGQTGTTAGGPGGSGPGASGGPAGMFTAPTSPSSMTRGGAAGRGGGVGVGGIGGSGSSAGAAGGSGSRLGPHSSASGPGTGAAGGAGSIMQSAAGGAANRGGMYGPGAMMPGGRGAGDQDSEHRTAGYLVTADNGDDLVGELPLVAPPVIG